MAIYGPKDEFYRRVYDTKCFFCGEHLMGSDCIYWMGTDDLVLHPSCCLDLMVRLMRDVWEYQNTLGGSSAIVVPSGEVTP